MRALITALIQAVAEIFWLLYSLIPNLTNPIPRCKGHHYTQQGEYLPDGTS